MRQVLDEKVVKRSWYGIAFSPDEKHLYASGGYDNYVLDFPVQDNKLGTPDTIRLGAPYPKERTCPTGMVTDKSGKRLFVVTKGDSSLFEINTQTRAITKRVALPGPAYSCLLSPIKRNCIFPYGLRLLLPFMISTVESSHRQSKPASIPTNCC